MNNENENSSSDDNENYKQIEDIIDVRKRLGHYNVRKSGGNYRYAYSAICSRSINDSGVFSDSLNSLENNLKRTDSEVTVVRMKCDIKKRPNNNKWDMQDIAIPGDGTHLGESPSLVNLATLVRENVHCEGDEYLVPLSSWEPQLKSAEMPRSKSKKTSKSASYSLGLSQVLKTSHKNYGNYSSSNINNSEPGERSNLAGKFTKFIKKHVSKHKSPTD